jgi:hypothetical protein
MFFRVLAARALEEQKQIPRPSYPSTRTFFLAWRFAPGQRVSGTPSGPRDDSTGGERVEVTRQESADS